MVVGRVVINKELNFSWEVKAWSWSSLYSEYGSRCSNEKSKILEVEQLNDYLTLHDIAISWVLDSGVGHRRRQLDGLNVAAGFGREMVVLDD